MTVCTLVRKEFRTALGSRLVWSLALVFTVFTVWSVFSYPVPWPSPEGIEPNYEDMWSLILTSWVASLLGIVPPIILGYFAVAGEYESGSLKVLFGFPISRREYLLGKFLAWGPVTTGVMLVGFPFAAVAILSRYGLGSVSLSGFGTAVLLTALSSLAWFGIGFGASAIASTRTRAIAIAVGLHLFFTQFWNDVVMRLLFFVVTGRRPTGDDLEVYIPGHPIEWHHFVRRISPLEAFNSTIGFRTLLDSFAMAILLCWAVFPVLLGYWRFRERDLGEHRGTEGLVSLPNSVSRAFGRIPSFLPDVPGFRSRYPPLAIARKELLTNYRSRLIQALVLLYSLIVFSGILGSPDLSEMSLEGATMRGLSSVIAEIFVPAIAILVGVFAIATEIESGTIRTLFGLPVTRGQVILGKALGRGAIVFLGLVIPSFVGAVALLVRFGGVAPIPALQATIITVLYGLAFLGIALVFSAVTSRDRALAGSFVLFGVFFALWRRVVVTPVYALLNGRVPTDGDLPPVTATAEVRWHHLLDRLNPIEAYKAVTLGVEVPDLAYWPAIVSLLAWIIVPVVLGYWRFRGRDVG